MRSRRRVALMGFGIVALVASVYNVALSDRVVGALLRDQLSAQLRAPCSIERVHFSFEEGLSVEGLTVLDPSAPLERSLMRVERARVDFRLGLFGQGFRISDVDVEDVHVSMARLADGSIPLLKTLRPRPPDPDATPVQPPTIRIAGGTVTYSDATLLGPGRSLTIEEVVGTLRPATTATTLTSDEHVLSVSGRCNLLGGVSLTGTLRSDERLSDLTVELSDIQFEDALIDALAPELAGTLREMNPTGAAALKVSAHGRSADDARIQATLRLLDVAIGKRLPNPVKDDDRVPENQIVDLVPVRVTALEGALVLNGGTLSVERLTGRLLGSPLTVSGRIDNFRDPRDAWKLAAQVELGALRVSSALRDRLPFAAMRIVDAYGLDLRADLSGSLEGTLADPRIAAEARVLDGTASYRGYARRSFGGQRRGFPWRVTLEKATVGFDGRRVVIAADATREGATVRVDGLIDHPPGSPASVDVTVVGRDVDVGEGIRRAFQDRAGRVYDPWGPPTGRAGEVRVHVFNDPAVDGGHVATDVVATFDGRAHFVPDRFPTGLTAQSGTLSIVHPVVEGRHVEDVVLAGVALTGDGVIIDSVDGFVRTAEGTAIEDLRIRGRTETLERSVVPALLASNALAPNLKERIGFGAPTGAASFDVHLRRDGPRRDDRVTVNFEGTSVAGFASVPLPVDGIHGRLEHVPGKLTLENVRGTVHGAPVTVTGWLSGPSVSEPHLDVVADGLALGGPLEEELGPWGEAAQPFFDAVHPTAETRAHLTIEARTGSGGELAVAIDARDLEGPLHPVGLALIADGGEVRYAGDEVTGWVSGRLGFGQVALRGFRLETSSGAFRGELDARALRFPEDLAGLLSADAIQSIAGVAGGRLLNAVGPEPLELDWEPVARELSLRGPVSFGSRTLGRGEDAGLAPEGPLAIERLVLGFAEEGATAIEGRLIARRLALDVGLPVRGLRCDVDLEGRLSDAGTQLEIGVSRGSLGILDRRLTDLGCTVSFANGRTDVRDISAEAYGGKVTGSVAAGTRQFAFNGRLSVQGANAEKALLAERDMGGVLDLDVAFRRRRGEDTLLEGEGKLEVREANLAEVPLVAVVVGPLQPGQFRTAIVPFELDGDWMRIQSAALESSLVAIRDGNGKVNLKDGRVVLVAQLEPLMGGPLGWVWRLVRETLFQVEITGSLRNPVPQAQYFTLLSRFFGDGLDENTEPVPADGPVPHGDWPW